MRPTENRFAAIEMEAIATPTFPRFFGFNSSVAMLNSGELKRQYQSHQSATEQLSAGAAIWQWVVAGGFAIVFFVSGIMMTATTNSESGNLGLNSYMTWATICAITLMGVGVGFMIGTFISAKIRYDAVYGETIVVDRTQQAKTGQVVVGHTYLKRLGFIARSSKRYFFGPTQEASVNDGMVVLEVVDPELPVTAMRVGELYMLPPGRGDLTGNAPADAYAYIQLVIAAGEGERRLRTKKIRDMIEEGGFVAILIVAIIAIFLQAQSGFGFDITAVDVTELGSVVSN